MIQDDMRVLVFSGHAADFCSRAGGTIIRLVERGGTVHVVGMTYGEKCESAALWADGKKPSLDEVKTARKAEMEAAVAILGATVDCFDFGDSPLVLDPERRLQVLDAIRAFRPELVLTHWINDLLHPDHAETTQGVLWASCYCGAPGITTRHDPCPRPTVVCYETTMGTAPVSKYVPDLYVDITSTFDRKMEALKAFEAQPALPEVYEVLNRYRAIESQHVAGLPGCRYAEGFARIGKEGVG
ncbi:MAG: PIG-L deacetylase family protein [Candidatus Latescibacteria bacterium]|jgi:4-oxalomesaconate hydratase|nr:PIG-L deacetylase family protein [Candidatus Latescibacterota bacterium]